MPCRRPLLRTVAALAVMAAGLAAFPAWAQKAAADRSAVSSFLGAPQAAPQTAPPPALGVVGNASADAPAGETIQDIRVEGTQRIDNETVISDLVLGKGDVATSDKLNASLKALYATGLFEDVRLGVEDGVLVVKVVENPVIDRVTFEGNDAVSKDDLEKEVQLKPRMVYTLPRVQRDVQRILDLYRHSGRFAAVVTPKIVKLKQNRVDLVFEINEGSRTGIRSIKFIGNDHFDDDALNAAISTRESAWWRFLSSTDYYDPDRLNYDKELLHKFYLREGYVDFRVLSAVAELAPDREDFFITFTLEEGQRYKFGKISIKSEIKGLDGETLRQYLTTIQGDWYNADQIDKSITALTTVLGDKQYAFVNITPVPDRHKDNQTVDITYDIKEGERVYIGRINVNGNTRTVDEVIRRQMQLAEGDPFSTTKVHKSEQDIKDLGFFETAKVTPVDGTQPDRADLNVDVKEKDTGEVSIGAGYSTTDGPLGDFTLAEHNFMGEGQDARFGATISSIDKSVDTSFTEPYFLGRDLSAGADLFFTETDDEEFSEYNLDSAGFNLRLGYPLSPELRQKINYTFHDDTINQIISTASPYIMEEAGNSTTSAVGQELTYDTRDSKLEPTLGYVTHFDTDVAAPPGSRKWVKVRVGGTQYYSFDEDWMLSVMGEVGEIWGIDGPTKINERFFLGGDTLRGFEYAGIGPRDTESQYQEALGGNRFTRGTLQMQIPSPIPPELGVKPHIFVDAGTLSDPDTTPIAGETLSQDNGLHVSAGVGVLWDSPFGPVQIDLARPVIYKSYDKLQLINFNFGTKF